MLASGHSAGTPVHVPPAELRTECLALGLSTAQRERWRLVQELEMRLQHEGARLMLGWSWESFLMRPHVEHLVPHRCVQNEQPDARSGSTRACARRESV
jgi:hypothetical protein